MELDGKRTAIAAVRRIVFAGLILLLAWLILVSLRGAIPDDVIQQMRSSGLNVSPDSSAWDWSSSLSLKKPVAELIGQRLPTTIKLSVFGGLLGLALAVVLLFLGTLASLATRVPSWLAYPRTILRFLIVNTGASVPIVVTGILLVMYRLTLTSTVGRTIDFAACLLVALMPAWMMVQYGQGEIKNWSANPPISWGRLTLHLFVKPVTIILRLVGGIIASSIIVEVIYNLPGTGRLLVTAALQRDFPLLFAIAWTFVLFVVSAKLIADLIEIIYNYFSRYSVEQENGEEPAPAPMKLNGWFIVCLVLVFLTIIWAVAGQSFASFDPYKQDLRNALTAPSAAHISGTDALGRDVFSRILTAPRFNLLLPMASTGIILIGVVAWAILAAFVRKYDTWWGDTLEDVIMLPRDAWCSFPWLVTGIMFMSLIGAGTFHFVLISSLILFPRTLGAMRELYHFPEEGKSWFSTVLTAIPVMVLFSIAGGIIFISCLGFLGFAVPPPFPEFGAMLSDSFRYINKAPWLAIWPGTALALLVMIWVMAGDALTERLGYRSKAVWSKIVE
jgi:peptide/nickel transport system permease protein